MGDSAVRTSQTHPLEVDWLTLPRPGRVGLTFAPGKHARSLEGSPWRRDLPADLDRLLAFGARLLVMLMEEPELRAAGLADLGRRAQARGLRWVHFPIRDGSVPGSEAALDRLLADLEEAVAAGEPVVIHCLGGLGRTGTVAGCYLVRQGLGPDQALEQLVQARGPRCPENDAQRDFIRRYARRWADRAGRPASPASASPAPSAPPAPSTSSAPSAPSAPSASSAPSTPAARLPQDREQVRSLIRSIETAVARDPERAFRIGADGMATLAYESHRFAAGRFGTPTIDELLAKVKARAPTAPAPVRLLRLRGGRSELDVGWLQAHAPAGTLFQVASQFNCLEAPGPAVVDVSRYFNDPTQGPRASISAFPATLLRHYRAPGPDGEPFVQTGARCLNLLAGLDDGAVRCGYLTTQHIPDPAALADRLESSLGAVRVGVHEGVQVVLGAGWYGNVPGAPIIVQVLTSTLALGGYSLDTPSAEHQRIAGQLLRAAYLGTLLAALAHEQRRAVLTLIGGGVFGQLPHTIWSAILWATEQVRELAPGPLDVLVNEFGGNAAPQGVPSVSWRELVRPPR